jgi:hypothetical protein
MKKPCLTLALALATALAAALASLAGAQTQAAPRAVWAPIGDQWAQYGLLVLRDLPAGHPDFRIGPPGNRYLRDEIRRQLRASLDPAHRRGIRTLDVMFFFDEAMFVNGVPRDASGVPDPNIQGLCDISTDWLSAIEDFNRTCQPPACEPFALRLRLAATAVPMSYFRLTDPERYPELPTSLDDYRALVTNERGETTRTSEVLDLGSEVLRRHVGVWLERILERVALLAPGTQVEMATLALDVGGETSLFSSSGITGFSDMVGYTASPDHERFFRERQGHLRSAIVAFADAVARHNAARGLGIGTGVFYQSWVLDDTIRGAFDLHALLEGVPVTTLHHTVWPRNVFDPTNRGLTEAQHRMIVAPSATAARRLGLGLDTEFSWPWYYPTGTFFSGGFYRWVNAGGFGGPWGTHRVGDVNGDRRADLLFFEPGTDGRATAHVALSNGSGFVPAGAWLSGIEGALLAIADFDGDGRSDLLHLRHGVEPAFDSLWVSRSMNEAGTDGFAAPQQWSPPGAFGGRWGRYEVGDFDGDGDGDLLFLEPSDHTLHVSLSTGSGFHGSGSGRWAGPGEFGGAWGTYLVGDWNGDGPDDLLFLEPSDHSLHVSLSTGIGFFAPGSGRWIGPGGFGGTWGRHYAGDFDGDGRSDLMFVEPSDDSVHVALSSGTTFLYSGVWMDPNHFGEDPERYFAADFTGPEASGRGRVDVGYLTGEGDFYMAAAYDRESGVYNAHLRSDDNARSFLAQARAGLKFGAAGITYANWTTGDLRLPPATLDWRAIIGPPEPGDEHLHGSGGLFVPPQSTPLPAARKAIYLSTLGKLRCQEAGTCRFPDYLQWFEDFGLTAEISSRQVDVLTDRMVTGGSLRQYDTIYLPYETALLIDEAACHALVTKHRNVRRQTSRHGHATLPFRFCP